MALQQLVKRGVESAIVKVIEKTERTLKPFLIRLLQLVKKTLR